MPSNGQHSFLPLVAIETDGNLSRCQCPRTGNTHFYPRNHDDNGCGYVCQCPRTGNTHFYGVFLDRMVDELKCVNALERATLISTWLKKCEIETAKQCQCPRTGNTHFYLGCNHDDLQPWHVSMPSNGQHSFLQLTTQS